MRPSRRSAGALALGVSIGRSSTWISARHATFRATSTTTLGSFSLERTSLSLTAGPVLRAEFRVRAGSRSDRRMDRASDTRAAPGVALADDELDRPRFGACSRYGALSLVSQGDESSSPSWAASTPRTSERAFGSVRRANRSPTCDVRGSAASSGCSSRPARFEPPSFRPELVARYPPRARRQFCRPFRGPRAMNKEVNAVAPSQKPRTDVELMSAVAARDPAAQREVVNRLGGRVRRSLDFCAGSVPTRTTRATRADGHPEFGR